MRPAGPNASQIWSPLDEEQQREEARDVAPLVRVEVAAVVRARRVRREEDRLRHAQAEQVQRLHALVRDDHVDTTLLEFGNWGDGVGAVVDRDHQGEATLLDRVYARLRERITVRSGRDVGAAGAVQLPLL